MEDNMLDTKTQIFYAALRLFAADGVENVSMRDIANAVDIKAASIYNHYSSKEQLVEACYDFFFDFHDAKRLTKEQYAHILQYGTKEEVVNIPNYFFPEELAEKLVFAMIVLFSRMHTDAKAIEVYTKVIDHSMQFMQWLFETGIALGRFAPFNIRGVSMMFMSARLFISQSVTIHPDAIHDWGIAQQEIINELINILPFKY